MTVSHLTDTERTILETKHWKVILRTDDQTYLGRAVVVCARNVASIPELTDEEWHDLQAVIAKYEDACRTAFNASMFNWSCLMNDAYQHTPPDPRVHWHVRPRYAQPVTFAGETFSDQEFGHHYARGTERQVSDEVARQTVRALREACTK